MAIKSDGWIVSQCEKNDMIVPYETASVKEVYGRKVISYGPSSYGYDIRVANEFKVCYNVYGGIAIDPKAPGISSRQFVEFVQDSLEIPANSMVLCRSLERFKIPRDVLVVCLGKSTYARCGLIVNVTPLEPEWEGFLTIEISNTTPVPVKIYANEGIAQLLFFQADHSDTCLISYKDKEGKYQNQVGVTGAKL